MANTSTFGRGGRMAAIQGGLRWWQYLVLIFVGLVAMSDLGRGIAVVAAITVIGLPIAFIIMMVPTVVFVIVATGISGTALKKAGIRSQILPFMLVIGAMIAIPLVQNRFTEAKMANIIRHDIPYSQSGVLPAASRNIFGGAYSYNSKTSCDLLCQSFLLSGSSREFIVARITDPAIMPDFSVEGDSWSLVRRGNCDMDKRWLERKTFDRYEKYDGIKEAMARKLASGYCLVSTKRPLGDAGAVIQVSTWKGVHPASGSLNPFDDMFYAQRFSYFEKDEAGIFAPRMRKTFIDYKILRPVLAYFIGGGAELRTNSDLWRKRKKNFKYPEDRYSITRFLIDSVGINLDIPR